jgi:hypothetical protein
MRMSKPVKAMETKKRVLVNRTTIALHGGSLALADFQLTPPFGNNMTENAFEFRSNGPGVSKFGPSITPRPNECGEERAEDHGY